MDISETIVKKPEENDDNIQHSFDDNRFVDHVNEHFVNAAAANHFEQQNEHFEDDEPELPNKIDIAEKRDYSKWILNTELHFNVIKNFGLFNHWWKFHVMKNEWNFV